MQSLLFLWEPIFTSGIVFVTLTAIAFVLRLMTKYVGHCSYGLDDLFLLITIILFYFENGIQFYCLTLAKRTKSFDDPLYGQYMKWIWISSTFAVPVLSFLKLSVLFFYKPLFGTIRWFRNASRVMVTLVVLYCICGTVGEVCESGDAARFYDSDGNTPVKCMDMDTYAVWVLAHVIIDTILDAMILAMPLVVVSRLQLPCWKKISICIIFIFGGFTVATNIIRLALMFRNRNSDRIGMINELWIVIHCGCGIICSCLPLYGPLIARLLAIAGNLRSSFQGTILSTNGPDTPTRRILSTNRTPRTERGRQVTRMESVDEIQMCQICHTDGQTVKVPEKQPSVDPFVDKVVERTFNVV